MIGKILAFAIETPLLVFFLLTIVKDTKELTRMFRENLKK